MINYSVAQRRMSERSITVSPAFALIKKMLDLGIMYAIKGKS